MQPRHSPIPDCRSGASRDHAPATAGATPPADFTQPHEPGRRVTANRIAALLDQGPGISCIPLPPDREAHWRLFSMDAEQSPAREISGLYAWTDGSGAI
ncbi:hypothetical protein AZ78_5118 [Lysobacter capsici AZ78]|uniref:Uncharacterized protein n=1 Tax=Lysobacter capsici AZ78 TaxID=1444315 RepID=A0A125U076_9GAMM|nr:hypothetical protein AZ78_5118 [Lysobacter capsici AZ78]